MALDPRLLDSLGRKNPLSYGITYIVLEQNRPWVMQNRRWSPAIYNSVNPALIEKFPETQAHQMVLMKPTQVGMSTMAICRIFHFADYWAIRAIYMLPRQQDYIDFVTTRVDPIIASSPRLKEKLGTPDSTRAKQLGNSYLFFMESTVEPRMMPADLLAVDELDLSDMTNVSTALTRLDNSFWKMRFYFSTPTIPGFGIHARFLQSNQQEWLVKCSRCNTWQEMDWENNLRVKGNTEEPSDVYLACVRCGHRFSVEEINTNGKWVASKPDIKDVDGFHISHLMVFPVEQVYRDYIDPDQPIHEFYRKRLGKPYEIGGGSISREEILVHCFVSPFSMEKASIDAKSSYYLGVDQGNNLQVVILKEESDTDILKLVYLEEIPFELPDGRSGFERVGELMQLYNIKKAVMDANPNRHSAKKIQDDFKGRVVLADYGNIKERIQHKRDDDDILTGVVLNRTQSIDLVVEHMRTGRIQLFGNPSHLPPIMETLLTHFTSIRRDIEQRRKEETPTAVWKSIKADHFVHATLYAITATELASGGRFKLHIVGRAAPNTSEAETIDNVNKNLILSVAPYLGGIRQEQAQLYFNIKEKGEVAIEKLPNPIRHKLEQVKDKYPVSVIEWVLAYIAKHDNEPIKFPTKAGQRTLRIR